MRRLLIGFFAACRTAAPTAPATPDRTPYLVLFERGSTFALDGQQATHASAAAATTIRCTVADTKQVGDASVAHLACDAPHADLLIAGTWVATPAGLYHPYFPVDDPDELALLGEDELLIAALPEERQHAHVLDHARETVQAFEHRGSWCTQQTTSAAAGRRSFTVCFDGKRVTGGADFTMIGAEWQRVEFGAVPRVQHD